MGVCQSPCVRKQNYHVFIDPSVGTRPSPEELNFGTNDSGFPELTDGELSDLFENTKHLDHMADESPGPEQLNRRQVRFAPGLLGFSSDGGFVTAITRKSRAWRSGVQVGWVITDIDGKPFTQARLDRKRGGRVPFTMAFATQMDPQKSFSMSRSINNFYSSGFVSSGNPI